MFSRYRALYYIMFSQKPFDTRLSQKFFFIVSTLLIAFHQLLYLDRFIFQKKRSYPVQSEITQKRRGRRQYGVGYPFLSDECWPTRDFSLQCGTILKFLCFLALKKI
jgi:hypothetical protein